jgi:hypothetical protein
MVILQYTNLALRFILELCVEIALGYWGFQTGKGLFLKIVLGNWDTAFNCSNLGYDRRSRSDCKVVNSFASDSRGNCLWDIGSCTVIGWKT